MKDEKTISRRSFLRTMGAAGAVSAGLAACGRRGDPSAGGVEVPSGGMTRRAFLVGYDRSVPRLRQADHCIGCGQCNPHCPQGIDIPKEMQRIDHFVEQLRQTD